MGDRDASLNLDLQALGAEVFPHVAGSLAAHLERTHAWLRRFGAREALCRAGLHHAVYGTAGIDGKLVALSRRQVVAEVIGSEAETIVYHYAACDRERFHPRIGTRDECAFANRFDGRDHAITTSMLRDFCELTLANELELVSSSPAFAAKHRVELRALTERMHAYVSAAGYEAMRTTLG